jgi:N-acetylglucosaminyldiphosphoundecaprenol N-acetyl-beta-D-mannosaminyltransferase
LQPLTDDSQEKDSKAQEVEALYQRYSRTGDWRRRIRRYFRAISWILITNIFSWGKRFFDLIISIILLLVFSPIMAVGYLLSGCSFRRTQRFGQWSVIYDELSFFTNKGMGCRIVKRLHIARFPVLLNIVKGDMSFVGPLPASPGDLSLRERAVRKRYSVRPGLISPWWIRRRANIDYGTELDLDSQYVENHGMLGDFGICLRAIPAILYGDGVSTAPDQITMLGIPINNLTMSEAINTILEWLSDEGPRQICFVNADCANIAYRNIDYLEVFQGADLCLADGIGLKLGGKLLSKDIVQNVNGTDMFPMLCESFAGTGRKLFLLGARPGVPEGVTEWIKDHYPEVQICGWRDGYFRPEDESEIIQRINDSGAHLLLVALGSPRQDLWIREHLKETGVRVAMGVGGLFDFYSGRIPRAPLWMREIGMEWLYRLIQEPGRLWKRYLIGNGLFLSRVLWERFFPKNREEG